VIKKISLIFLVLVVILIGVVLIQPSRYETLYLDNGYGRIAYKTSGNGDLVILAHGFASDDYQWELMGLVDELDDRYQVVTYDARGHGDSYTPAGSHNYGLGMVEDVAALMDELGAEKAHIVGHSMGAMTALKFATLYPERTLSVVSTGMGWLDGGDYTQKAFARPDGIAYTEARKDCFMSLVELSFPEGEMKSLSVPFAVVIGTADEYYENTTAPLIAVRPDIEIVSAEGRGHIDLLWWAELNPIIVNLLDQFSGVTTKS
jgi:pimeloyl-ACP methyl ester carboxylesterase